jgi:hypothetical protein
LPIGCSGPGPTQKIFCRKRTSAGLNRILPSYALPEAWLATVVTRLCIDRLRSAKTDREVYRTMAAGASGCILGVHNG